MSPACSPGQSAAPKGLAAQLQHEGHGPVCRRPREAVVHPVVQIVPVDRNRTGLIALILLMQMATAVPVTGLEPGQHRP